MAKLCIDLLVGGAQPVHSAAYPAGPEKLELKKVEIVEVLKDSLTKPTQTNRLLNLSLGPRKMASRSFARVTAYTTQ